MIRLGVYPDFPAEGWPSMDLCAGQLLAHLPADFAAADCCPPYRRLVGRLLSRPLAVNADRLANRYWTYPRYARRLAGRFDLHHIVDHSYAQLVRELPAGRCGVYAHDLDTFRCLLDPPADPRPGWYCRLVGRTLAGLRAARLVFHNSAAVGQALLAAGLVPVDRLVHAPLGVAAEFTPAGGDRPNWLPAGPFVLHVGSCIPRKRMDVLLDVFAAVRPAVPGLRLVKVGPPWTADQAARRDRHGLTDAVVTAADLSRAELAAVYRAAAVVLLPSDAEGFGLPLIEALACGAAVVASDLPVLREVGGPAVVYAPVADVPAWAAAVRRVLTDPTAAPPPQVRRRQAELYSWGRHAAVIADAYRNLWGELCAASSG